MGRIVNPSPTVLNTTHHYFFIWRIEVRLLVALPAFVAVGQRCFVAVMAIGNHKFLVRKLVLNRLNYLRIRHRPHPVYDVILVTNFDFWLCARSIVKQRVHPSGRVVVQHEELARVGLRVP